MKWLIYLAGAFVLYDLSPFIFDRSIDAPFSGLLAMVLAMVMVYTICFVLIIRRRQWMDKYPVRTILLLSPVFLFILLNFLILLFRGVHFLYIIACLY